MMLVYALRLAYTKKSSNKHKWFDTDCGSLRKQLNLLVIKNIETLLIQTSGNNTIQYVKIKKKLVKYKKLE